MFPGSERQEEHAYQTCNHLLYEDKYIHIYKTQKYIYTNTLYPHKKKNTEEQQRIGYLHFTVTHKHTTHTHTFKNNQHSRSSNN